MNDKREMTNVAHPCRNKCPESSDIALEMSRIDMRALEQHYGSAKFEKYAISQQFVPHYYLCELEAEIEVIVPLAG